MAKRRGGLLFGVIIGSAGYWAYDRYIREGYKSQDLDKKKAEERKKTVAEAKKRAHNLVEDIKKKSRK